MAQLGETERAPIMNTNNFTPEKHVRRKLQENANITKSVVPIL
jgi:hypothetical protein